MRKARTLTVALFCLLSFPALPASESSNALPPVVQLELGHLEETYRVLDVVATKIWPGWTDFREVPFLLNYDNGLRVLIGHPNPPPEFAVLPGLLCAGRAVAADRSRVSSLELKAPLSAGGGPIGVGQTADGRLVTVVDMKFTKRADPGEEHRDEPDIAPTENQMLIYIHELFHCFQQAHVKLPLLGNFHFNPDLNFAVYAELESRALQRAYSEPDTAKARDALGEFLVARRLKRAGSMVEPQGAEESSDEVREGGATYAEVRTLEILASEGFRPGLSESEDTEYHGFARAAELLKRYSKRLQRDGANSTDNYGKAYTYGCFQALLCQRHFPGWQQSLAGETHFLDAEIAKRLNLNQGELAVIERRLKSSPALSGIRARHANAINARDSAYLGVKARSGRTYILDFKRTGQYLGVLTGEKGSHRVGLVRVYPNGLQPVEFDDVRLSRVAAPTEVDQLHYIRVVDTEWKERPEPFSISGDRQSDGSWKNAEVRTPLFVLAAPHLRVRQSESRIKIQVLARVK